MNYCILNDSKICDNCGECNKCDLDPTKFCDNCCKCIENPNKEYNELNIAEYFNNTDSFKNEDSQLKEWSMENLYNEPSDYMEDVDPELLKEWEDKLKDDQILKLKAHVKTIKKSTLRKR